MNTSDGRVTLTRDCPAVTVPYGESVVLDAGGHVYITQQLGTSVTVRTELGLLLRIDGRHADALGLESPSGPEHRAAADFDLSRVMAALNTIYDPEIPISIVELGLVYRCEVTDERDGTRLIEIDMTMTAPSCGMGDILIQDVTRAVSAVPGVDHLQVNLVWEPPWTIHRLSEPARLQLGLL